MRWRVYLQSYVITIRHISGAKNTVADWLSRMYPDLFDRAAYEKLQAKDSDVSCMLLAMIGGWDSEEELPLYCNLDVWEYDVGEDLDMVTSEYLDAVPDEVTGEVRTWTPEEMFKKISSEPPGGLYCSPPT